MFCYQIKHVCIALLHDFLFQNSNGLRILQESFKNMDYKYQIYLLQIIEIFRNSPKWYNAQARNHSETVKLCFHS